MSSERPKRWWEWYPQDKQEQYRSLPDDSPLKKTLIDRAKGLGQMSDAERIIFLQNEEQKNRELKEKRQKKQTEVTEAGYQYASARLRGGRARTGSGRTLMTGSDAGGAAAPQIQSTRKTLLGT